MIGLGFYQKISQKIHLGLVILTRLCVVIGLCAYAFAAGAQTQNELALNTVQQARAQSLYTQIRCPICTAQPISESDTSLSKNMREQIAASILDGRSDQEIVQNLTQSYGDDIWLKPRFHGRTYLLWGAPWLILGGGLAGILIFRHRQNKHMKICDL